MAGPSNIRINPFTGTGGATNYVELTERHIIPVNSPYVIRLNEVPEKQDPSNIKMVYVDSATGAVTENVLTEVAATPVEGEFRPDYSTNAMEDKTWNTGLIEFSASDAGKIVQVTYTGTGTLAGVNSNHWPSWYTDRGDGSDGDFVPTENTDISGIKQYSSVNIPEGITVTVKGNVFIKCTGTVNVIGTLSAKGQGAAGGARGSTSGGNGSPGENGYGCGRGGSGQGVSSYSGGAGGGSKYFYRGSLVDMTDDYFYKDLLTGNLGNLLEYCGAGGGGAASSRNDWGGSGEYGGGCIIIVASEINISGLVTAAGQDYPGGNDVKPGSGGGGLAILIANRIDGQDKIDVKKGVNGYTNGTDGRKYIKELGVI